MKYLKIIPFVLVGIYFTIIKTIPNIAFELKIIMAVLIFLLSTFVAFKTFEKGGLRKERLFMFLFSIILSVSLAIYFLYLE